MGTEPSVTHSVTVGLSPVFLGFIFYLAKCKVYLSPICIQMVSHDDASFNISRTVLTLAALKNRDAELLKASFQDKLHQNYRMPLIPEHDKLFNSLQSIDGIAYYLSGAGPTIMVIAKESEKTKAELRKALNNLQNAWCLKKLQPDLQGAVEL